MNENIVTSDLPENIAKEFSIDAEGKGFISRKGLAKLCGATRSSIQQFTQRIQEGKQTLPKYLEVFAGYDFQGGNLPIPDTIAAGIIKYYAYQGRETAQATDMALGAIGLRTFIQRSLNYQPAAKRKLSQAEIIELCVLPVPSAWTRRFPEEFYDQLSRLTGLEQFGTSRPPVWAKHTKELVYDWLPSGVYEAVKACKAETGGFDKLHQFLKEDGLRILEQHQKQLLTLMRGASTMQELRRQLAQSRSGKYQLVLIEAP